MVVGLSKSTLLCFIMIVINLIFFVFAMVRRLLCEPNIFMFCSIKSMGHRVTFVDSKSALTDHPGSLYYRSKAVVLV